MTARPHVFAQPHDEHLLQVQVKPLLASWNSAEDPSQKQLEAFLAHALALIRPTLATLRDPLALRLDVAIPSEVPLLDHRDLDNYAFLWPRDWRRRSSDRSTACGR